MANKYAIIGLDLFNFEGIKAFSMKIDQDKGLVTIGGENAQGKTSILDGIEAALGIVNDKIKKPCRDGEPNARLRTLISDGVTKIECQRWWEDGKGKDEGKSIPKMAVRMHMADGNKTNISQPSSFLKGIIQEHSVDPVEFLEMQPKDQRAKLIKIVGLDTTEIDAKIKDAHAEYQRMVQAQKTLEAIFLEKPSYPDAPSQELSMTNLSDNLQDAMRRNQEKENKRTEARRALNDAQTAEMRAKQCADTVKDLEERLALAKENLKLADDEAKSRTEYADKLMSEANQLVDENLDQFRDALHEAERTNIQVRENQAKEKARTDWSDAEAKSAEQWQSYLDLNAEKKDMLSKATFPVEGLGFDSDQVTLNGQPFSQASGAERIRAAVGISLASEGNLPLILIRDASILDNKSLQILADEAEKRGAQVFCEIVANRTEEGEYDKPCTVYVYDGLRDDPKAAAEYDLDGQSTLEEVSA